MARPLRTDFQGALHHVTSRGNERRNIFRDDTDRRMFLRLLGETVKRFGWSLTAYVLMSNHYHFVVQTPLAANLSRGMHWFNSTYVGWFNRRHQRCGHLYQGRFKAKLVEAETYFADVLRYVVLNPLRAGMVERPEEYRWSSYRATAGLEPAPEWLDVDTAWTAFAPETDVAQAYYRDFVAQKIGSTESLWDKVINGIYLGTESWAKRMRRFVESKPRSTDHPKAHRAIGRPQMYQVIAAVATVSRTTAETIRSMRGGPLRRLAAWIGWNEGWITLRSIAASLRLGSQGHVSGMIRRLERELSVDPTLLGTLDCALGLLRG